MHPPSFGLRLNRLIIPAPLRPFPDFVSAKPALGPMGRDPHPGLQEVPDKVLRVGFAFATGFGYSGAFLWGLVAGREEDV